MKKLISLLMTLCLVLSMSISVVNAEEVDIAPAPIATQRTAYGITVVDNTVTPAKIYEFTGADLDKLATTKNHSFSGINNQGTVKIEEDVYGVNLKILLRKVGFTTDKKLNKIMSIDFDASGDITTINTSDLFETRYYYSKLEKLNAIKGKVKTATAKNNRKSVSAIIALGNEEAQNAKLYFGQKYASERNWPKFWGNITTITLNKTAVKTEKWENPVLSNEKEVAVGTAIAFTSTKGFVYYTLNGKNPIEKNAYIYNYAPKLGDEGINAKVFNKTGKYKIKAVVKGFGKKDSKVKTFTVKVLSKKAYEKKYPVVNPE